MLRLITGRAGSGKTALVIDEICSAVARGEGNRSVIVPEQYSHEAEREMCAAVGDKLSLYVSVLTFSRLARLVAEETGNGGRKTLDAGGRLLCMALALDAVGGQLKIYGAAGRKAETQLSLLRAVDELKNAGFSPEDLEKASTECTGTLCAKLADLSLIMSAYDSAVGTGRTDPSDELVRLAEALPRSSYGKGGHVYIDGFPEFSARQTEVIRVLAVSGIDVTICLTCEGLEGENDLFALTQRTAVALVRMAEENFVPHEIRELSPKADTAAEYLTSHLLDFSGELWGGDRKAVQLRTAESITAECEFAAAKALEFARSGCRWKDIAVAVRGFEDYRGALESAFDYYGVPLFTARRADILQKPISALIAAAYNVIEGDWENSDIFCYLRTGLAGLSQEECDILENYCLTWDIRSKMWLSGREWRFSPDGPDGRPDDKTAERLEEINSLRARAAGPLKALSEASAAADTALGQATALANFFEDLSLAETLEKRSEQLEKDGRPQTASENTKLWELTVAALEQTALILGNTAMDAGSFHRLFLLTLSQYSVGIIPVSLDMVTAGDFVRMRRRDIKHLIVLGASDERLPYLQTDGGIFSRDERDDLFDLGLDLGGGSRELLEELSLIYSCLSLPTETLTMVSPAWGQDGNPARPSFVMNRASALFGTEIKASDRREVKTSAPGPALELAAESLCRPYSRLAACCAEYFNAKGGKMKRLEHAANLGRGSLSAESVRALYGEIPRLSATRADKFASCRFAYFLKYGLQAKPRRTAGLTPPEYGVFMHYILENVARDAKNAGGFEKLDDEQLSGLTDKYSQLYAKEELGGLEDASPRFRYLFGRLLTGAKRVVADMAEELRSGQFEPLSFELNLPDSGSFSGIADRVDGWVHNGSLYLRVVDYKTGKKSFSLSDVMHGLNLQMLLYLFALGKTGEAIYGRPVKPAGVMYIPAWDRIISSKTDLSDEEIEKKRASQHRRTGLFLNDPAVLYAMENGDSPVRIPVKWKEGIPGGDSIASAARLGLLERRVGEIMDTMAGELRSGSICARPFYKSAADNACNYCEYKDACRFTDGVGGDALRYLQKMKNTDIWAELERGAEHV